MAYLVQIENGGEICVDHESFAKYNKISKGLVKEVSQIKLSVNDAMAKFVELLLNEFESEDEEKE